MNASWLALAAGNEGVREWQSQLLRASPIIAGVLLLLALVIAWLKRWRKSEDEEPVSSADQLAHFQNLYFQGELSKEEFERVQARLSERMQQPGTADKPASPPVRAEGTPGPPELPATDVQPEPPG